MTKHAGHNRYVSERIAKAKQTLGITVTAIHVADSGEIRLSSNWVKVHLDELLVLAEGLADCEARVVAAEEQRTMCAGENERLSALQEEDRARAETWRVQARRSSARAEKAERELADACAQIATLNRQIVGLEDDIRHEANRAAWGGES